MHEYDSQLKSYQTKINTGIAVKAVVSSFLLFAGGFHLYYILWHVLGVDKELVPGDTPYGIVFSNRVGDRTSQAAGPPGFQVVSIVKSKKYGHDTSLSE